ncbi:unnamed protein product [Cylindrotheca closterium]|uniref:Uncharacterized protein n=1 Tax=Cylindrotheca closterium TaxID=2856 RepID=A0AAD2FVJ6_9STRA|nr:unnamed protein product [Cylindrotheca closterium]
MVKLITRLELAHDDRKLIDLIANEDWKQLRTALKEQKDELTQIDKRRGWTVLHYMCAIPSIPDDIFATAVRLYPIATSVQGTSPYCHLPLHVFCGAQDHSFCKVQVLLEHMRPDDLLVTSYTRGSLLHHAYRKQVRLSILQELIRANPKIVLLRHHFQLTPLHAEQYGLLQVRYLLRGIKVDERRFQEYWAKVVLIATAAFKLSTNYDPASSIEGNIEDYTLHGLQFLHAPHSIQHAATILHPKWASIPDSQGNYPLHNAILDIPPKNIFLPPFVKEILEAFPEAVMKRNTEGESPIFVAMRKGMTWEKGIKDIVRTHPESLYSTDHQTGLFPFLLAASLNQEANMETSYQLLCSNPSLLKT